MYDLKIQEKKFRNIVSVLKTYKLKSISVNDFIVSKAKYLQIIRY